MVLVATVVEYGAALAIYADAPVSVQEVWDAAELFGADEAGAGGRLFFPSRFRVVAVGTDPAPAVLPPDLSESINDS